jgi:hypothetical protein
MLFTCFKICISAILIASMSWLAGKKPALAGFIIAMPITSLLVLAFSFFEHRNHAVSIDFAKGIMLGLPISWLFFVPFFFADKLGGNFWYCYISGIICIMIGFFVHRYYLS